MSIQSRVKDFHTKAAAFHSTMARAHSDMAKADGMEGDASDFHHTAADAHTTMGEYHCECAKADFGDLEKSFRGSDEVMPTRVSAIAPDLPAGVRAVPRFGQRQVSAMPEVDEQFRKIIAVDEDQE